MMTLDQIFGVLCLPYRTGWRPCVETAWVMPMDRHADMPTFGTGGGKTVWELAENLTFVAIT